jgi:flagellar M-ring protein FliF
MLNGIVLPPVAQQWIDRIGGPRRAGLFGVGIGAVLLILGIARWATAPVWVPVYSDLPLESVGTITERLDEERIAYRLGQGGSQLLVASGDLPRARVTLAREGMPQAGRPGLEIFDQPAWGMTDFTQRINYRRGLEGELERTIGKMRGVEAVKVHIAMEETAGFRRGGRPSEASVVLRLRSGMSPTQEVVQGISHLVASSVDGVAPERVMVLDDTGRLLSSAYEPGSPGALASRELKMRSEVEQYLGSKAEELVARIVGPGNVRVQVSADINLDRIERTVETMDPERQVLSSEQRSEIIPGPEGGAGSTSLTATYMNTRSLETFTGGVGNIRRLSAAVLVNDRRTVEDGVEQYVARPAEELAQIQALVAGAMGLDAGRGDLVSVVSFPFDQGIQIDSSPSVLELLPDFHRPIIAVLALLLTFVLALRLTRTLKSPVPGPLQIQNGKGGNLNILTDSENPRELSSPSFEELFSIPENPKRDLVAAFVEAQPETSARILRAWLKED